MMYRVEMSDWVNFFFGALLGTLLIAPIAGYSAGCIGDVRPTADDATKVSDTAQAANAALPMLVENYRSAGVDIILEAKVNDKTKEQARAELDALDAAWRPIWAAWERLHLAHEQASVALAGGDDAHEAVVAELESAYCGLLAVWPKDLPVKPLAPIRCLVVR